MLWSQQAAVAAWRGPGACRALIGIRQLRRILYPKAGRIWDVGGLSSLAGLRGCALLVGGGVVVSLVRV